MPTLPSGVRVWLSMEAILLPENPFYPCPHGCFWYRDLDPAPGWDPSDAASVPERFRIGLVPESRLDVAAYVRVLFATDRESTRHWRGDWLLTLERPDDLTDADWDALLGFLGTRRTLAFLDLARARCEQQSEARAKVGFPEHLMDFGPGLHSRPETARRLAEATVTVESLAAGIRTAEDQGDLEGSLRGRQRLESLLDDADRTLDRFGPHRGLAHRVIAAASAHLGFEADATRHARAFAEIVPGNDDFVAAIERRIGGQVTPLLD